MKKGLRGVEAFRVKVINGLREATHEAIIAASNRSRSLVEQLLSPLKLGDQLGFGFCEDDDAGWLIVRIGRTAQAELFVLAQDVSCSLKAGAAAEMFSGYIDKLRQIVRAARISGAQLETYVHQFGDVIEAVKNVGVKEDEFVKVSIRSEFLPDSSAFCLSGIPQKCLGPTITVDFAVKMIGREKAEVVLSRETRRAINCARSTIRLRFADVLTSPRVWHALRVGMLKGKMMRCDVTGVVSTGSGHVTELLLKSVPQDLMQP